MSEEKPYSIVTENRGSYLYAIIGGFRVTPATARDYWTRVIEECDELGLSKILVEKNFVETVSTDELVEITPFLDELMKGRTVAFVDRYHHDEISKLGKALARRKEIRMKVFGDVEAAEKWLLAN